MIKTTTQEHMMDNEMTEDEMHDAMDEMHDAMDEILADVEGLVPDQYSWLDQVWQEAA